MGSTIESFGLPRRGDRLNQANLQKWLRMAADAGFVPEDEGKSLYRPPAGTISVVNVGSDHLSAWQAVSLEQPTETQFNGMIARPLAFQVRAITDADEGTTAAILRGDIPAGGAGRAYVTGVCPALLTEDELSLLPDYGIQILWRSDTVDTGTSKLPCVVRMGGPAIAVPTVQIIGGQTVDGVDGIQYAADPQTYSTYDPDVDATYDPGLGRAWLFPGFNVAPHRVLVRHGDATFQSFLLSGRRFLAASIVTLDGSGQQAYTLRWP